MGQISPVNVNHDKGFTFSLKSEEAHSGVLFRMLT